MRILVAGASGAIGRALVRRLRANQHEVFALTQSRDSAAVLPRHRSSVPLPTHSMMPAASRPGPPASPRTVTACRSDGSEPESRPLGPPSEKCQVHRSRNRHGALARPVIGRGTASATPKTDTRGPRGRPKYGPRPRRPAWRGRREQIWRSQTAASPRSPDRAR